MWTVNKKRGVLGVPEAVLEVMVLWQKFEDGSGDGPRMVLVPD